MASRQSVANRAHYAAMAAKAGQPMTPQEIVEHNDIHWTALTAEPRGVDYFEVDAGGIPAMWIAPKGAADDREIFYAHGGGFVSGSIYTHRKMVGHLAKAAGCRALDLRLPTYAHQAKYPAQLDATVAAYRWLLGHGIKAEHVAFAGGIPAAPSLRSARCSGRATRSSRNSRRHGDLGLARHGAHRGQLQRRTADRRTRSSARPAATGWRRIFWATAIGAILSSARSTPTLRASRRSSCRPEPTKRSSTTAACSPSGRRRQASRSGSTSFPRCCTASR